MLPLKDVVNTIRHKYSPPRIKAAYVNFLIHCYLETDAELQNVLSGHSVKRLFDNFLSDMARYADPKYDLRLEEFNSYVSEVMMTCITDYFRVCMDSSSFRQTQKDYLANLLAGVLAVAEKMNKSSLFSVTVITCLKALYGVATESGLRFKDAYNHRVKAEIARQRPNLRKKVVGWAHKARSIMSMDEGHHAAMTHDRTVVEELRVIVKQLQLSMLDVSSVELSVLVEILHKPHLIIGIDGKIAQGAFLTTFIRHVRAIKTGKDDSKHHLKLNMLRILCMMLQPQRFSGDNRRLRLELLPVYFTEDEMGKESFQLKPIETAEVAEEVQNLLDENGASDLLIDLINDADSAELFQQTLLLGIALLDDGNEQTQASLCERLTEGDSTGFFERLSLEMADCKLDVSLAHGTTPPVADTARHETMILLLRFLQLLCENHNATLQNLVREQPENKRSFNLVLQTIQYLDHYGLALHINSHNVKGIVQCLQTLTEYCQGPCRNNQQTLASHGLDIIIKELLLGDVNAIQGNAKRSSKIRKEWLLELKKQASHFILSIVESQHNHSFFQRITNNIDRTLLVKMIRILAGGSSNDDGNRAVTCVSPCACEFCLRDVGRTIYILAATLAEHDEALSTKLQAARETDREDSLAIFAENACSIEIFREGHLEKIIFPRPAMCNFLTEDSKSQVFLNTDIDEQGSKIPEFFVRVNDLFEEIKWQKKLKSRPTE